MKGEYDKAIADYDEAIKLDPKNANAYSYRGLAWYWKSEYDKAIADYDEAIKLDPKSPRRYSNRGDAWQMKGGVRQGHRRLRRGHQARPEERQRLQLPRPRMVLEE